MPTRANSSHFSDVFKRRFDQLIPPMPSLTLSTERHQAFQQALRHKLLAMPSRTMTLRTLFGPDAEGQTVQGARHPRL